MDVERLYRQSGIATEANSQFRSSESIQSGFPPTFHFSRLPSPDPLLRDLLKRNTRKILELRFKSRMRESDAKRFRNVEDFRRSFFIRSLDKIFGNRGGIISRLFENHGRESSRLYTVVLGILYCYFLVV